MPVITKPLTAAQRKAKAARAARAKAKKNGKK